MRVQPTAAGPVVTGLALPTCILFVLRSFTRAIDSPRRWPKTARHRRCDSTGTGASAGRAHASVAFAAGTGFTTVLDEVEQAIARVGERLPKGAQVRVYLPVHGRSPPRHAVTVPARSGGERDCLSRARAAILAGRPHCSAVAALGSARRHCRLPQSRSGSPHWSRPPLHEGWCRCRPAPLRSTHVPASRSDSRPPVSQGTLCRSRAPS